MAADSRRGSAELLPPRLPVSRRSSCELLPHPALEDIDPTTRFLYTPHTITALLIGALDAAAYAGCIHTAEIALCSPNAELHASAAAQMADVNLYEGTRAEVQRAVLHSHDRTCHWFLLDRQSACRAGVALVVYYSSALNPPPSKPEDFQTAYFNVRHGIVAAALVYLGALPAHPPQLPKSIYRDAAEQLQAPKEAAAAAKSSAVSVP